MTDTLTTSADTLCRIPRADLDAFAALNHRARQLVRRRLRAMRLIHSAPPGGRYAVCLSLAAACHGERGWSAKNLLKLYAAWRDAGHSWRALVDAAVAGPAWHSQLIRPGLPEPFLDYLAQLWTSRQRDKFRAAWHQLIAQYRRWQAGDPSAAIPGYDACPTPAPHSIADLPAGWSYPNLLRAVSHRASRYARKLVQIGPKAASQLGPKIPSTRVGLRPGQYYLLDDSWADFKVLAYGQTCRLLGYHVLDLASGCHLAAGHKPALRDEETQVEQRLKERELVWLLVHVLTSCGYLPAGTTLIGEKATARLRDRELAILADAGIPVSFQSGPAGGGPGIAGLFTGPAGGNPRWKAPLESWFALLRNRTDSMLDFPAQTGSNARANLPESLAGLERDALALVHAARVLAPDQAELLRLGMLPCHEAVLRLAEMIELINRRTDHALEGWRDCGYYVTEWRLDPSMPWQPARALLDLPDDQRANLAAVLDAGGPALKRERPLSPREVWDASASSLTKLPIPVAALLLADLPGQECAVRQGQLTLTCPDLVASEPLVYGLMRRDGAGADEPLRDGDTYLVRVNPLDPRVAWLYGPRGEFRGITPRYGRVRRDDPDALTRAYARKRQALAPLLAEARRLAAPITRDAADRTAANLAILGPAPGSRSDRQRQTDRSLRDYDGDAADFLAPPADDDADPPAEPDPFSADALL